MNTSAIDTAAGRAALNFELAQDTAPPEWIGILPPGGTITGRDGRQWVNDRPDIILQAFAVDGKDIPIDWEHSTELKAPEGEQAPAAGWIKELRAGEDGAIEGRVEWTPKGVESLLNREYRYLSPVFRYELESRRIFRITSCGLTNQPNLHLNALNHEQDGKETTMELAKLLAELGLPATATFLDALNRIGAMKAEHATALNQAQNPPLDRFVPRGDYDTALNRAATAETELKRIRDEQLETAINAEIGQALKDGKITPATKEYHVAQCRMEGGLERFKEFAKAAPVIGGASGLDGRRADEGGAALNAEELKVVDMMGLSLDDYKKANNIG